MDFETSFPPLCEYLFHAIKGFLKHIHTAGTGDTHIPLPTSSKGIAGKHENVGLLQNPVCSLDARQPSLFDIDKEIDLDFQNMMKDDGFIHDENGCFRLTKRCISIIQDFSKIPNEIINLLEWVLDKGKIIPSESDLIRIIEYQKELEGYLVSQMKNSIKRGHLYERFIGSQLEKNDCKVEYRGIKCKQKGVGDGGIDLICRKNTKTLLIQCKNWKKNIPPKDVLQLIGSLVNYSKEHSDEIVKGAFFAASFFTVNARKEAKKSGIELFEKRELPDHFPMIKCYTDKNKRRFYYLPMDIYYDEIDLNLSNGDCYCLTVLEAEMKGYKRDISMQNIIKFPKNRKRTNPSKPDDDVIKQCLEAMDAHTKAATVNDKNFP